MTGRRSLVKIFVETILPKPKPRVCDLCGDSVVFMFLVPKNEREKRHLQKNKGHADFALCESCHKVWDGHRSEPAKYTGKSVKK